MTKTTRSAVLERSGGNARPYAQSKPLRMAELDLDSPGPGEVLVRIEAAGLCHSDLSVVNGDRVRPMPMALGHEGTGIVEAKPLFRRSCRRTGKPAQNVDLARLRHAGRRYRLKDMAALT